MNFLPIMKKCSKCGELKPLSEFYTDNRSKYNKTCWCKICTNTSVKIYKNNNKNKIKEKRKTYQEKNKVKISVYKKTYRRENREKIHAQQKKYDKKYSEKLNDCYIKGLLTVRNNLKVKDIPLELIELKRKQIELIRLKREMFK